MCIRMRDLREILAYIYNVVAKFMADSKTTRMIQERPL